ncbi:MAG: universal stress protein [Myxococcales bacterium]|nr:universal stress protein [Myxococcales bacterium]
MTHTTGQATLVCATDLSDASRVALDVALEIASLRSGAPLHLLYVVERVERIESAQAILDRWDERKARIQAQIEEEVAVVHQTTKRQVRADIRVAIRQGKPHQEIVRYALEVGADTIVVGTHGRTGLGHAVLGSVAERVARYAACDVVVAKPPEVREHMAALIKGSR